MLVSYGSDAESDDEPQTAPQIPHSVPTKSTEAVNTSESKPTGGLQLPAPKGKKANRGPVKISLTDVSSADAPAPDAEPAKKRPKLGGFGGGGLASLLPAPKKDTAKPSAEFSGKPVAVEPNSDAGPSQDGEEAKERSAVDAASSATMMMPKSVKRKQPDAAAATATTKAAPVEDMFGLGSVSSSAAPTLSSSTSTSTSNSVKKAFTAAPTVAEKPKQNYYATLPPATPDNPYPGFHCIPQTGQWEPDRPEEWSEWAIMHGWAPSAQQQAEASTSSASQAPRGFEGAELGDVSEVGRALSFSPPKKRHGLNGPTADFVRPTTGRRRSISKSCRGHALQSSLRGSERRRRKATQAGQTARRWPSERQKPAVQPVVQRHWSERRTGGANRLGQEQQASRWKEIRAASFSITCFALCFYEVLIQCLSRVSNGSKPNSCRSLVCMFHRKRRLLYNPPSSPACLWCNSPKGLQLSLSRRRAP